MFLLSLCFLQNLRKINCLIYIHSLDCILIATPGIIDDNFVTLQKLRNILWNAIKEIATNFHIQQKANKRREGSLETYIKTDQEVYKNALEAVSAMYER